MPTYSANLSPGVSIVIVSAHESHRLLSTLRSIPVDFRNLEVILVVPESDKGAGEIIRQTNLQRIRIFNDFGLGVYRAMNIGLAQARYTHVLFLNTGDLIVGPKQLNYCLSEIERDPSKSYVLPIKATWDHTLTACVADLRSFIAGQKGSYVSHQGVLFLTTFISQKGRFDERFRIAADFKQLCVLYSTNNYSTLDLRLVQIEYPNISSKYNRRGRFESIVVTICYLRGLLRVRASSARLLKEFQGRL
jgi:glycosyltransferase involved in cell wall biosynthesis